jgi:hypothetical protein
MCQNVPHDSATCTFDGGGEIKLEVNTAALHLMGYRVTGIVHARDSSGRVLPSARRPGDAGADIFKTGYLMAGWTFSKTFDFGEMCKFGCVWSFKLDSQTLNDVGGYAAIRVYTK